MPLTMSKLYHALLAAGVSEEEAMEAAEEAALDERFATKDDLKLLGLAIKADVEAVNGRINLLTWMVGFVLLLLVLAMKLFFKV